MKASILFALVATVPVGVGAQAAAAPPTDPITASFKARSTALRRNIAQAFDSIPAAKFGYAPTPAQLTIGYIAQHLISDNNLFCSNFGDMKPDVSAEDAAAPDSVRAKWPRETLITKLKASMEFCDKASEQLTDAKLGDQITMTFGGRSRNTSRSNMVLGHALDLADHYSQLANYMRLNNILPPTALPRPAR